MLSLCYKRERLSSTLLPLPQSLRLTQTLGVACYRGVAPRIALALDRPKELESLPAPRVPPLEDVGFIGSEDALPFITPPFALGEGQTCS